MSEASARMENTSADRYDQASSGLKMGIKEKVWRRLQEGEQMQPPI